MMESTATKINNLNLLRGSVLAVLTVGLFACQVANSQNSNGGLLNGASIPGAQTTSAFMASASDGMSRYLAPDGPIQPAITAIGGLPMRAGELANNGITSISSGFDRTAQRFSQAAGQNGQIRMPGLDTAASMMPASFGSLGESLHGMIRSKNNFIRGQAERGIEAANRMGETMRQGLQVRSSGAPNPMDQAGKMMGQAQDMLSKGSQQIKSQLQQTLHGTMGRMQSMQGIGSDIGQQFSGYGRTLSQGVQGAAGQLQQTGQQLMSQIQQNHNKNMSGMSGMLSSLQGSMGQLGQNMQKNLSGLSSRASSAAQELSSSLQSAVQKPLEMVQNLGSSLMKGASSSSGGAGRY